MATPVHATQAAGPTPRDSYWQAVRGGAMIAVIWAHLPHGLYWEDSASLGWNFDYWLVLRQLINSPVAVFLFLSGFFVKVEEYEGATARALRSRWGKLLIPYAVWSLVYTLVRLPMEEDVALATVLRWVFLGYGSHLYFILVLVQLTALTPLLIQGLRSRWAWALWLVTPLYLVLRYAWNAATGADLPYHDTWFLGWLAFYLAGLWMRMSGWRPARGRRQTRRATALVVAAAGLAIAEAYAEIALGFSGNFASSQVRVGSFLYTAAVLHLLFVVKTRDDGDAGQSPLADLGDISYGVYYVHLLWVYVTRRIQRDLGILPDILPVVHLAQGILVLGLSVLTVVLVRRLLGPSRAGTWLGF